MDMFEFGTMAGLGISALLLFLLAWAWAVRSRRSAAQAAVSPDEPAASPRRSRSDARLAALETLQADLAARIDALVSAQNEPEERLQALASQILSLIRDKNATLETALAGLDQLRARMRALEQVGDLAETRELLDALSGRLETLQTSQSADIAVLGRRIERLEVPGENPFAEISEQLTRLYAQKDDAIEAVLNRIGPLERRLSEMEGQAPARDASLEQVQSCLSALQKVQEEHRDALSALCAGVTDTQALADGIAALRDQKAEIAQGVVARLDALEQKLVERDPDARIGRLAERLESLREMHASSETALRDRLTALENPGQSPFAEISEQLTRLYAQKDAVVETVLARLAPLEAQLADLGAGAAGQGSEGLLARLTERLDALKDRVSALETPGESPFAEISDQLASLYAQKDAAVETVFARLAPLEAKLEDLSARVAGQDPQVALSRFADRLETLRSTQKAATEALKERVALLEAPGESPFAAISEQLTQLYAQKDAAVETVLSRLAPLEAQLADLERKFAARDPQILLERFNARLESLREMHTASDAALKDRLSALENPGQSPFAEISAQLTSLYAQKDATVETVFARLAPLEAKLDEMEAALAAIDPRGGIAELQERIEDLDGRQVSGEMTLRREMGVLAEAQAAARSDFAALRAETVSVDIIAQRLEGLHAQKDALSEALMSRMRQIEETVAANDPGTLLDGFSERLEALKERVVLLETPGESPFAEISEQLTRLYAQKDATVETVFARLAPLETKLTMLESGLSGTVDQEQFESLTARLDALDWGQDELAERVSGMDILAVSLAAQEVSSRLAPIEAKLVAVEDGLAAQDPRAALDRFSERLEALKERVVLLETPGESPFAEISEQLTRLYAQKDATVETVFARLVPLEAKLAMLETGLSGAVDQDQIAVLLAQLDDLGRVQEELAGRMSGVETRAGATAAEEISSRLAPLETRLAALAEDLAAQDPRATLDRFSERLEALKERVVLLETPGESPFAEISEQLTRLYAQKDATVETVFARLVPLEAKLAMLETGLSGAVDQDQIAALLAQLDDLGRVQEELAGRMSGVETRAGATAAEEISSRLAPLETRLAALAEDLAAQDPRATLDRFSERLEALKERVVLLETPGESPFAEISEQLTRLYAQKDATVETVFARLAPLETKLTMLEDGLGSAVQPGQIEAISARLDALDWVQDELADRVAGIRNAAEDTAEKAVSGQVAPIQARLAEMEGLLAAQDPSAVLDRFSDRLESLKDRVAALETPDTAPLAEITDRLAELYAQKDATLETVSSRLAPLERKLAELESGLGSAVRQDQFGGLAARLDALAYAQESTADRLTTIGTKAAQVVPMAEIRKELAQAFAGRDANIDALLKRLMPLEDRLADLEARPWDPDADEARAQAQEVAMQLIAARAAAQHTELFADRLALLETTLPRLSATQTILMQTLERRGGASEMAGRLAAALTLPTQADGEAGRPASRDGTREGDADEDLGAIQAMPRVISLHQK